MSKFKKALAILLVLTMVLGFSQVSTFAELAGEKVTASLPFAHISDTHYYPESLMGSRGPEWQEFCRLDSKLYNESKEIITTALDTIVERAKKTGIKYVLISGDLTRYGEYKAHTGLAEILGQYQKEYGLQFYVVPGNHDINQEKACTFENDKKEQAPSVTPDQFREIYADFGYGNADAYYAKPGEKKQGALSYAVDLDGSYRLIAIDSAIYSFDKAGASETGGKITDELMGWIKGQIDIAKGKDEKPIVMLHHSLAAHMKVEPSITFAFPLENYMSVAEQLAAWGVHYAFTGHLHTNDASCTINDDGDTLYDFEAASITGFPNVYREDVLETLANGETRITTNTVDFDDAANMVFDGVKYEKNSYKYKSFDLCFGGGLSEDGKANIPEFLLGIVKNYIGGYLTQINDAGGIIPFLKTMGIDLKEILSNFLKPYIGNGFKIGSYNIFSVDNLMWFIEDLAGQISDLYIKNPNKLYDMLKPVIEKLGDFRMSKLPCTKFIDTYGFGDPNKPGTLADVIMSAMYYWYTGNETTDDDAFMNDVMNQLENGDTVKRLFNTLIDLILNDIVDDALLSKLEIRVNKLLANTKLQQLMGDGINYLLSYVLRGDFTYANLVNTIFALGVLPYSSLYDVLDKLLIQKYLTDSQFESIGIFVAYVVDDFSNDTVPQKFGDYNVTYTSEKREVEATQENYRLPTMVSVTMGNDSKTQATINWFSKFSLEDTDIEIYKADSQPKFTGEPTTKADFTIKTESKSVTRQFPGIDLGVIGFIQYEFGMVQHTVSLSNLKPGATYYYRVGNAEKGWWSPVGKVTTANGGKNVTFFHMTDPQSQNAKQYNRAWAKVLKEAYGLYPNASFIINTGDLVDHGNNNKQWQYVLDCGADELMNTFLMPVSGNHEGKGENATDKYFVLPNMPQQDTTTGVHYSFDYNNVHIAVINTNDLNSDNTLSTEQVKWLENDMVKSTAQWKFVALHKAIYSQGSHYKDKDVVALRNQLSELMPLLDVDMVFQGHDHVYLRTNSIDSNKNVATDIVYLKKDGNVYKTQVQPTGTSYVITGCAGVKSYIANNSSDTEKYFPKAAKTYSIDAPMFAAIQIEDGVLYFDAYVVQEDGTTAIDRFAIQKDKSQGTIVPDYEDPEEQVNTNEALSFVKTMLKTILKIFKIVWNVFTIYIVRVDL